MESPELDFKSTRAAKINLKRQFEPRVLELFIKLKWPIAWITMYLDYVRWLCRTTHWAICNIK
jgi:hypothetical protein